MPPRKKKQGKQLESAVVVNVPKGSLLEELILSGRERRLPPAEAAEHTPKASMPQQTPDRAADNATAKIKQTSADTRAFCPTCVDQVELEVDQPEGVSIGLVCCSQCGRVLYATGDSSADNAAGDPDSGEDRGRERSDNGSNSDRDDCKRQAVATDSSDDMVLETSETSTSKTAEAASTACAADTADRIVADANRATPIADKERLQRELESLNALIPQLEARKATLVAQLSPSEVETAPPPSAPTQSQPAMQAEPSMQTKQTQPARQPPTDTGHSASTAPPAQPRTVRPPMQPRVAALHVRTHFVFKAPQGTLPDTAASLKDRLTAFLQGKLPDAHLPVTDAVLFGSQATSTKVFFTLGSLEAADALVGLRSALKGSGASIQDFLTPEELKIKCALWPRFIEARARGQRAQFHRARLVVS